MILGGGSIRKLAVVILSPHSGGMRPSCRRADLQEILSKCCQKWNRIQQLYYNTIQGKEVSVHRLEAWI